MPLHNNIRFSLRNSLISEWSSLHSAFGNNRNTSIISTKFKTHILLITVRSLCDSPSTSRKRLKMMMTVKLQIFISGSIHVRLCFTYTTLLIFFMHYRLTLLLFRDCKVVQWLCGHEYIWVNSSGCRCDNKRMLKKRNSRCVLPPTGWIVSLHTNAFIHEKESHPLYLFQNIVWS